MRKFQMPYLVLLFVFALFGASCQPAANNPNSAGNSPANGVNNNSGNVANSGNTNALGKNFKVAFVTNNASDFWTIARKGVEKADGELDNVTVEFKIPGEGTAAEQKRIID